MRREPLRVLITGHNGYIGSVMAPFLRRAGHDVVGLDAFWFADCTLGSDEEPGVASVRKDIRDVTVEDLTGFDAVVHLAALSNDPVGDLEPEQTYEINHRASVRLAELAREAGCERFLYSSSCSIYGASGGDDVLDESAPFHPVTPYAESKVRVEDDLHALADDRFSPVSLRNATAYGVSPRHRTDIVLNDLVAWAHLTGQVKVLSDGTPWRPLIHIEDISRAFLAALEAPRDAIHDQAFNVGSAVENWQIAELANVVGEVVPDCRVVITGETGPDPRSYRVDFSKISRLLPAFQPAWTARKGAEELSEAYTRHGLTEDDFRNRYKRLPWLAALREQGELDDLLRRR